MKKYSILILIAVSCIALGVVSCRNGASRFKENNGISFDSVKSSEQISVKFDSTNATCQLDIQLVFPKTDDKTLQSLFVKSFFGEAYASLSPEDAAKKYTQDVFTNYRNDAKELLSLKNEWEEEDVEMHEHDYLDNPNLDVNSMNYTESLSDTIVYNAYQLISYQVKQIYFKGNRRGSESIRNFVIDLSTNDYLSEKDIFKEGYEEELHSQFIATLLKQNDAKTIEELEEYGYFGLDEMYPNNNFWVDNKGITYVFNRGEYSAMLIKPIHIFIPYAAVQSFLKPGTSVFNLASKL